MKSPAFRPGTFQQFNEHHSRYAAIPSAGLWEQNSGGDLKTQGALVPELHAGGNA